MHITTMSGMAVVEDTDDEMGSWGFMVARTQHLKLYVCVHLLIHLSNKGENE